MAAWVVTQICSSTSGGFYVLLRNVELEVTEIWEYRAWAGDHPSVNWSRITTPPPWTGKT